MNNRKKQDDAVIKALDLKVIRRIICKTDKGELELVIRKGETKYFLALDSVPLDKEVNDQLMDVIFPAKVLVVPQVNKEPTHLLHNLNGKTELQKIEDFKIPKKKGGRPAKSK